MKAGETILETIATKIPIRNKKKSVKKLRSISICLFVRKSHCNVETDIVALLNKMNLSFY